MSASFRILAFLGTIALLFPSCSVERERPGLPPQVALLVTVAGLRADHTSMLLYPLGTTERAVDGGQAAIGRALGLDDLATEGVLFANAFAPSCDPLVSLGVLMTGCAPASTGVVGPGTAPAQEQRTLAEGLREAGFDTVAFVTHAGEALGEGWQQGFDHFAQYESDLETLGSVITWIGDVDFGRDKPLLMWLHLDGPRFPFEPGALPSMGGELKDFAYLYTDPAYDGAARGSIEFRDETRVAETTLAVEDKEHLVALYDGEVAMVTELLFRFFDLLRYETEPDGVLSRTLMVFAGTGGVSLPRAGSSRQDWGREDQLLDETLRVPLFLRHPDSLTGRRIFDEVVGLMDITPTLFEWFECSSEEPIEGHSLLALTDSYIEREFPSRDHYAITAIEAGRLTSASIRSEGWRYVLDGEGSAQLFHAERDFASQSNEIESEPERARELRERLETWLRPLIP